MNPSKDSKPLQWTGTYPGSDQPPFREVDSTQDPIAGDIVSFFEFLQANGNEPQWSQPPMVPKGKRPFLEKATTASISCASGPIHTIIFRYQDKVTEYGGEDDEIPEEYAILYEVSCAVRAEWADEKIPGLNGLLIRNAAALNGCKGRGGGFKLSAPQRLWMGNGMGLGIISQLNSQKQTRPWNRVVTISTVGGLREDSGSWRKESWDGDRAILIDTWRLSLSRRTGKPRDIHWISPSEEWPHIEALAAQLAESPAWLPQGHAIVRPAPAPRNTYVWWAAWLALWTGILVAGMVSIFAWIAWVGGVLSAISVGGFIERAHRLVVIRVGCEVAWGRVTRMWEPSGMVNVGPFGPFIRVDDLPFSVPPITYGKLSQGQEVAVLYWPRSRRVIEVRTGQAEPTRPLASGE